ncbi:catalase, partial [Staphylococcus epidermidis]|uniref:catalase n=1 Tax=Staphylococcus epidermidis TaxID=1282 RepID=UPI0011A946A1
YFLNLHLSTFTPTNILPPLHYSPHKILQPPLFSYGDPQPYPLPLNHSHIPLNQPNPLRLHNLSPFTPHPQIPFLHNNQPPPPHYYP